VFSSTCNNREFNVCVTGPVAPHLFILDKNTMKLHGSGKGQRSKKSPIGPYWNAFESVNMHVVIISTTSGNYSLKFQIFRALRTISV